MVSQRKEDVMAPVKTVEFEVEGYTELHVATDVDPTQFEGPVVAMRDDKGNLYIVESKAAASLPVANPSAAA